MKKTVVFFIVGVVLFGVCSAQSTNAQSANIAQKIIGTWVDDEGDTWIFNANGNLSIDGDVFKFGVTDTQLVYMVGTNLRVYNISISSDGKTLILVRIGYGESGAFWLIKK